jgi:spore coat polysaccharide biosynthesis protein SpsF
MTRIVGVLQARMGSSRLPGKALRPLAGKPLVWHMIDRMRRTGVCDKLVLATTVDPRNEPLIAFARGEGMSVVQAEEEDDLAGRIALAVKATGADYLLKTGGDCPLIDPEVMAGMVRRGIDEAADFCSNRVRWSYPLGLSCDVVSATSVLWCDKHLKLAEDRELFALYIRDHGERFKVVSYEHDEDLRAHGWTVDTPEDYEFVCKIFNALYRDDECFGLDETLRFLSKTDQTVA